MSEAEVEQTMAQHERSATTLSAGEVGFCSGLLYAQQMANDACHKAHAAGEHDVANALAELSTDLLLARQHIEAKATAKADPNVCTESGTNLHAFARKTGVCKWCGAQR